MIYLYHYFDKKQGPFLSVTDMDYEAARELMNKKLEENPRLVNPNIEWFLKTRYNMEKRIRNEFISIGGIPVRQAPVYMTLGGHPQFMTWYEEPDVIKIPVDEFDSKSVSYTYGDSFPVFNTELNDGRDFWEKVYFYDGIIKIIDQYGYPPFIEYDVARGIYPADKPINHHLKYIEAHIWNDDVIKKYREKWEKTYLPQEKSN